MRNLILMLVLLAPLASPAADRGALVRLSMNLVKVEAVTEHRVFIGTGVPVAPGKVVTNCHVTRDAQEIRLVRGGLRYDVTGQWKDLRHDLCLLSAPGLPMAPVTLGRSDTLALNQPVVAIGFNGGVEVQFSDGIVKALYPMDGSSVIRSSTAFTSGASGGGLFDQEGRLVGVLTFRLRGGEAHYFAMPVDWFAAYINDPSAYVPVAPLGREPAFWQAREAALPLFMQAASLDAGGRWDALMRVAARWTVQEGSSANAWYAQGRAASGLSRLDAAVNAFRRALGISPKYGEAWYALGLVYLQQKRAAEAREAFTTLRALDEDLARRLAERATAAEHFSLRSIDVIRIRIRTRSLVLAGAAALALSLSSTALIAQEKAKEKPISEAEKALFMRNYLSPIAAKPATVEYDFAKTGALEKGYQDKVVMKMKPGEGSAGPTVNVDFLTGERRVELPEVTDAHGNPVVMYFLERDVREMQRITSGKANYYRKRIRLALADDATMTPVTVKYNGHDVKANQIRIEPYRDDPARSRFDKYANKAYLFTLSEEVPGGVYEMRTVMKEKPVDPKDGANPVMVEEVLSLHVPK